MTHDRRTDGTSPRAPRALATATLAALLAIPAVATSQEAGATTATDTMNADTMASDTMAMEFSPDLSGPWTGGGEVLQKIEQERPLNVKCDFTMDATDTTLDLTGECGVLFVKRPIAVSLTREDGAISGTYEAQLRTGPAKLEGSERDGVIEMDVEWGGEVNGDTEAEMRIMGAGPEGLRIVFTDVDPATGKERTTSDLILERG